MSNGSLVDTFVGTHNCGTLYLPLHTVDAVIEHCNTGVWAFNSNSVSIHLRNGYACLFHILMLLVGHSVCKKSCFMIWCCTILEASLSSSNCAKEATTERKSSYIMDATLYSTIQKALHALNSLVYCIEANRN